MGISAANSISPNKKATQKKSSLFSPVNTSESEGETTKNKTVSGATVDLRTSSRVTNKKVQKTPPKSSASDIKSNQNRPPKPQRQTSKHKERRSSNVSINNGPLLNNKNSIRKSSRKISEKSSESSTNSSSSSGQNLRILLNLFE